ncbi:MAG: HAMP domain-containing sensor histidine kinase [Cyclobacteriaceae bacterium]
MLNQATSIVLIQNIAQALLAFIVMFLLNRFYKNYQNKYFQYWSWSWLALMIYMIGSTITLASVFYLGPYNPLRTPISIITVLAGLLQSMWLLIGSYELSHQREFAKKWVRVISISIGIIAILLVLLFTNDPDAGALRIFLRVGVKSLFSGVTFIFSAILIFRLRHSGIGIKFIFIAFSIFGLEQLNYFFSFLAPVAGYSYIFETPYYLGIIDFLLQAVMGIGMIISVLELERDKLKKANAELDTFLYRSSHDLRAPLTAILGLTNAIKRMTDPEDAKEFLDLVQIKVQQADKVIKDIITLRKGQQVGLTISKVNVTATVSRIFDMMSSPSNNKIKLILEPEQYMLVTDQEKLDTALGNVLSNAMKYHNLDQPNPKISVMIKGIENGLELRIEDNGIGIEEKYLSKIFNMFYRANKNSQGSGLGLYLTKDAITQIGGKVEVYSKVGVGTTFKITLKNLQ